MLAINPALGVLVVSVSVSHTQGCGFVVHPVQLKYQQQREKEAFSKIAYCSFKSKSGKLEEKQKLNVTVSKAFKMSVSDAFLFAGEIFLLFHDNTKYQTEHTCNFQKTLITVRDKYLLRYLLFQWDNDRSARAAVLCSKHSRYCTSREDEQ